MEATINELVQGLQKLGTAEYVRRLNDCYSLDKTGKVNAISLSKENKNAKNLTKLLLDKEAIALEYINVSGIEALCEIVFKKALPELIYADFSRCVLTEFTLPPGFLNLKQLYLHNNKLQQITFQGACSKMILLDLAKNELSSFSLPLGFIELAYLYLPDNKLKSLQLPADAKELNILHLNNNELIHFPDNLITGTNLESLYMAGNTPKNIPAVFLGSKDSYRSEDCLEEVRLWFEELRRGDTDNNKTVKLMLTGNSDAGKTSIVCALKSEIGKCVHDHSTTHGIQIDKLKGDKVDFNVWDFGGQEIYHGTHRLFMTAKALQLIVFDPESENSARNHKPVRDRAIDEQVLNQPIEYWYETARELCEESRFLIVQNKYDKMPATDLALNQYAVKNKAKFLQTSALQGNGIDELKFYLRKYACQLPDYDMPMPASWLKVRDYLIQNLETEKPQRIISQSEFEQLCTEEFGVGIKFLPLLQKYLLHIGYIYSHRHLGDTIILDQRWALEAIYKLLDRTSGDYTDFKEDLKGKIRVKRIFESFGDAYEKKEKWIFLDFMKSCGLCFQLNSNPDWTEPSESDVYVYPRFLPEVVPVEVENTWQRAKDVKKYRYKLDWLNYFVIQAFIVSLGRKTETEQIWRNGISVQTGKGWFRVELNQNDSSIIVIIEAEAEQKWLIPIMEELKTGKLVGRWEFEEKKGQFSAFNRERWIEKQSRILKKTQTESEAFPGYGVEEGKSISFSSIDDKPQPLDRDVMLFFAANPFKLKNLDIYQELYRIGTSLKNDKKHNIELFDVLFARKISFQKKVIETRPKFIHFAGHGKPTIAEISDFCSKVGITNWVKEGGLVFHDNNYQEIELVSADNLRLMFENFVNRREIPIEVVVLNACYSAEQAQAIADYVPYVIGIRSQLADSKAIDFSQAFYSAIADGDSILQAFRDGCSYIGSNIIEFYEKGTLINH